MIPKIIHFVWVGSAKGSYPLPAYASRNKEAWEKAQSDYKVMFWDEGNLPCLAPEQEAAYRGARNAGESSDVIRHNLLRHYGGYSMDMDIAPARGMIINPLNCLAAEFAAFEQAAGREASALMLSDGSRVLGSAPQAPLITELCCRLPLVIAEAREKHPDLRVAFTGWHLIQKVFKDGFGAGETLTLPGRYFPTAGRETPAAIGIHDFAAEWVKQIA